ncbi:MAG: NifB/NifX family molybdenum-iron cluster-binding protein [Eubacteriales bacterium]
MRVCVASEEGIVSQHFGHASGFVVYEVENGKLEYKETLANPGHQPGVIPVFLKDNNIKVIIAGGMGSRAQELFQENGIEVFVGVEGKSEDLIKSYALGKLVSTGASCGH